MRANLIKEATPRAQRKLDAPTDRSDQPAKEILEADWNSKLSRFTLKDGATAECTNGSRNKVEKISTSVQSASTIQRWSTFN